MKDFLREDELYKTTDINCATALYCLGYKLESIDKNNPSKSIFCLQKEVGIDESIKSFWSKELRIEPQHYSSCLREIKNRLYNTIEY